MNESITSNHCGACLSQPNQAITTIPLFRYQSPINKLITQLKFHHKLIYAKFLGKCFVEKIKKTRSSNPLPELIIPVPLHYKRLQQRGFNQALEIARPISKILKIPIDFQNCFRARHTQPQSTLSLKERGKNIKNAFKLGQPFKAKHIALVDDVVTTGNTIMELSQLLLHEGACCIEIWCCARASPGEGKSHS